MLYLLKMVMFHSYVSLPEGNLFMKNGMLLCTSSPPKYLEHPGAAPVHPRNGRYNKHINMSFAIEYGL